MPFFHYTSLEGIKGIVEGKTMWATHINFLNDEREWIHFEEVLSKAIHELDFPFVFEGATYSSCEDLLQAVQIRKSARINAHEFVLSFSKIADSKSQWSEYCPKNAGYALEFSECPVQNYPIAEWAYDSDVDSRDVTLVKCLYDEREQVDLIKSILRAECHIPPGKIFSARYMLSKLRCRIKHPGFIEEAEYRWHGRSDSKMAVRVRDGIMIPYVSVPIDITKLSAIWVGPRPAQNRALEGLSLWWSILQRNDKSYIFRNSDTGVLRLRKSEIPYSFS